MRAYERLLRFAAVNTVSSETAENTPSTACQFDLANILAEELRALGASEVMTDEHAYVYAKIPATPGLESKPCIGFLAHVDTVPDFPGENVKARVIEHYDGGPIPLGESGRTLRPEEFPDLLRHVGKTLIVTDGTTLLGADDKAGVAEIMSATETLLSGTQPHGPVAIGFCPDEEIGHGAALLDLERFGAELAYTVDGGTPGEIEYENFNAAAADIQIRGFNVHPGAAKDVMVNAALVAAELNALLPAADTPRHTEGYEGFFHLTDLSGNVEAAKMSYIIRDHDAGRFEARKELLRHAAALLNEKYGEGTVTVNLREQYWNMLEKVKPRFEVVEKAMAAAVALGTELKPAPIRGGTDGAQLSHRGLPCPNLPTGSYGHHGPFEHAVAEEMDECTALLVQITIEFAK